MFEGVGGIKAYDCSQRGVYPLNLPQQGHRVKEQVIAEYDGQVEVADIKRLTWRGSVGLKD